MGQRPPRPHSLREAWNARRHKGLQEAMEDVKRSGNCSGCGACARLSDRVSMSLDAEGFMRPEVAAAPDRETDHEERRSFERMCPGVRLSAPSAAGRREHPVFGSYVSAWEGWASDDDVRLAGSSGGLLTALTEYTISTGLASAAVGCAAQPGSPSRTVPVRITSRDEALRAAGSRYAPVSTLAAAEAWAPDCALVAKPCEASAFSQLHDLLQTERQDRPLVLSFFCAGTPSQSATDSLVTSMGVRPEDVTDLRYRGMGWPGDFVVRTRDGSEHRRSYEESWGSTLGKRLQWRCKLCPDGTGEHADVAVGDYWRTDAGGFPLFHEAAGSSVAIARTDRGHELLAAAARAGRVDLRAVDLDMVAAVQPYQVHRRLALLGRLAGRLLTGRRVPRYSGYRILRHGVLHPRVTLRGAGGTVTRSLRTARRRGPASEAGARRAGTHGPS